jgi:hypothetical protein
VSMIIVSIARVKMGLHVTVECQTTLVRVHRSTWDHIVKLGTIVTVRHVAIKELVKMN